MEVCPRDQAGFLQEGTYDLLGGARVGGRFQDHQGARSEMGGDDRGGGGDGVEVRATFWGQRCGTQMTIVRADARHSGSVVARKFFSSIAAMSFEDRSSMWERALFRPSTTSLFTSKPVTWRPAAEASAASGRPT